jgi:hypothetical protein
MTFSEVKQDYLRLKNSYGQPYDMTGGFVAEEQMEDVILNPTKNNAKRYMMDVIRYGFQNGTDWRTEEHFFPINSDPVLKEIFEKYH